MLGRAYGSRLPVTSLQRLATRRQESNSAFKSAESFMAELCAMGFTPQEIKNICTKHPDMLSSKWTPEARKQKWEMLKRMDAKESKPAGAAKQATEQ